MGRSIVAKQDALGWGKAIVDLGKRPAKGVSRDTEVFSPKSMEYAAVLLSIQGQSKTPTIGWRNKLD